MKHRHPLALAATAALLALGVGACGSDDGGAAADQPADQPAGTSDAGADDATPGVPGSTVTPDNPDAPAACTAADVSVSYEPGDSGAGKRFGWIVVTNTSDAPCSTGGFGGLSYVGGGDGAQVGAAADRDTGDGAPPERELVVEPGAAVHSQVAETSSDPYPAGRCDPTEVDGFRVYLPNETASAFVKHPTTGCAEDRVHLLESRAYTAV